jgi:hypothetical protein
LRRGYFIVISNKDTGFVRVQFNGAKPVDATGAAVTTVKMVGETAAKVGAPAIQAAFQRTAVKGLNIGIGGQVPVQTYEKEQWGNGTTVVSYKLKDDVSGATAPGNVSDAYEPVYDQVKRGDVTTQYPYIVGMGFDFAAVSPFRFYGRASCEAGGYTETTISGTTIKIKGGGNLLFSFTPMYTIADGWIPGLEIMLDVQSGSDLNPVASTGAVGGDADSQYAAYWNEPSRAAEKAALKNNCLDLGFGPFIRHNFKDGDVRFGVTAKIPGGEAYAGDSVPLSTS